MTLPSALISVDWLAQHLDHPKLVLLDASWYLPAENRNGAEEWQEQRIQGSIFFDFDTTICAPNSDLPHMLPSPEQFTEQVQALGINQDSLIIVYDGHGMFSSPRVWWMFKAMGHDRCAVLNGGLPAWIAAGHTVASGPAISSPPPGDFTATLRDDWVSDSQQVLDQLDQSDATVIDARPAGRFEGKAPEPRPGLRSGHIPGSKNLPFDQIVQNGKMVSDQELADAFASLASKGDQLITSCGSGVTAAVLALAAHIVGYQKIAVYDGSWAEWGAHEHFPIE